MRPHPLVQQPMYNVEHVFEEDGREVRKMPIKVNGDAIWVDCMPQSTLDNSASDSATHKVMRKSLIDQAIKKHKKRKREKDGNTASDIATQEDKSD